MHKTKIPVLNDKKLLAGLIVSLVFFSVPVITGCTPEYEVNLEADPKEAGEVSGSGTYQEGQEVTIEADAEEGYEFIGWKVNDEPVSSDKIYRFMINEDNDLIAAFKKQTADYDLEQSLPEELEQLIIEEKEEKISGGALGLEIILEKGENKDLRGPPLDAVTHFLVEDRFIELEDILTSHQLEQGAPSLAEQLDEANIIWYYNGKLLFSIEDIYNALEEDWHRVICKSILEDDQLETHFSGNRPEEPTPRYFDAIGFMKISPSGEKIAFDLDFIGACAVRICAAGIIDLEDKEVFFTNIGRGDLALKKSWSPDERYLAYISSSAGPAGELLHVDDIEERQNTFTVDKEKINAALKQEGLLATLHPRESGFTFKNVSWPGGEDTLHFTTNLQDAVWQEPEDVEIQEIVWDLNLRTGELAIKSAITNNN